MVICAMPLFVLDTPRHREVIKRRSAKPHHGNCTPPRIAPSCPHCVIPRPRRAVTGQEYLPIAYHCRTGCNPVFIAGGFSLIAQNSGLTSKITIVDLVSVFLREVMAQPLMWLMLIAIAMGKYLMNGYEIVNVQPIHRKQRTGERKYPLTCFHSQELFVTLDFLSF